MMKKVLVLLLVLVLTSMASAVISIKVVETDGVTPYDGRDLIASEYLNIIITATGGDTGDTGGFALVADTALGAISGGVTNIPPAPDASMLLGTAVGDNFVGGLAPGVDGIVGTIGAFTASPPYADGDYFTEILFHCEGPGDVVVSLYDISAAWSVATEDGGFLIDSVVIHQIPEPMTIALLGLGGLFLRRRK
jgi:hypothetical protein